MLKQEALTTGNSEEFDIKPGKYVFGVAGTMDGATVTLELNLNGIGFAPYSTAALAAIGCIGVSLPSGKGRYALSGEGGSTNVNVILAPLS